MTARGRKRERARTGSSEPLTGMQCVREALRADRRELRELEIRRGRENARLQALRALAAERGLRVLAVDEISGGDAAQRVALHAGPLPRVPLDELVAATGPGGLLVALDQIEDPQNLGAIARVAEGAGADGLILPGRRSASLSPAVSRASAGAIEWLPISVVGNLTHALEKLRGQGFWIASADGEAEVDVFAVPDRLLRGRLVLVLGSEGHGLRPGVRANVDHPLRIPMRGHVASLNVATAAAVLLYEIGRRRGRFTTNDSCEG